MSRWMLALAVVAGCVPKSQYLELENQLDNCRDKLDNGPKRGGGNGPYAEIVKQLQPLVDRGVLEVAQQDGRTIIGMKSEVLFPSGSAALSPDGRGTVREIGEILARQTDLNWQVEGHTDNEPISTAEFPDNWHLGGARSVAVLQVLINSGMDPGHLSAATFGEFSPVASNGTPTGKALNRRIEIVMLPEVRKRLRPD
ncbi:MAG: OmpA family protein [Myxococcota bacterium]